MKKIALAFFFTLAWSLGSAQDWLPLESLKHQLGIAKDDTSRILKMAQICHDYSYINYDSAIVYGQRALKLLERYNFPRGKARVLFGLGCAYLVHGDISKALETQLEGLQLAEKNHLELEKSACLMGIGFCYNTLTDNPKAIEFFKRARIANKKAIQTDGLAFVAPEIEVNLGEALRDDGQLDSAMICLQRLAETPPNTTWRAVALQSLSDVYILMGKHQKALECLTESLDLDVKNKDEYSITYVCLSLSNLYRKLNQPDSCIFYSQKAFGLAKKLEIKIGLLQSSKILAEQYEIIDLKQALYYRKIYEDVNAELYGPDKVVSLQKTVLAEQERQRKAELDRLNYQNQVKQYTLLAGLGIMFLIGFILYRNNRQKQKANQILENTLSQLKSTQAQLIQKEKLASLGELTAGIAHEIQNPLNFVNNFSELSVELIEELGPPSPNGGAPDTPIGGWGAFLEDITQNLQKINHHGKRASSIVKGMLEHSRMGTGERQLTDLNALCDEYLRLSYHGMRAKDKSFNADFELITDQNLPKINVVPQDIGRVLLNLINNAFYAVNQRNSQGVKQDPAWKPKVIVQTRKLHLQHGEGWGEVIIQDNGTGMSEATKAKIFQPFFTTKPTGEGTGLGLSLAYDIVTKGHGGTITVESEEGNGTTFTIKLPI